MRRVLVTGGAKPGKAGVATIVYRWGQEFDEERLVYDYLMQSGLPDKKYQDRIRKKGGRMYTMDEVNMFSVIRWVEKVIKKMHYEVLHINTDSAYIAAAYIFAAKKGGIKKIFVHSHSSGIDDNNPVIRWMKISAHYFFRPYIVENTDAFLACSKEAGKWMFGKKNIYSSRYKTIYNGIHVDEMLFNEAYRKAYREKWNVKDSFLICNIGRFSFQKKHLFLLEVFKKFNETHPGSRLVLVGFGELEGQIRKRIHLSGLDNSVMMLGQRGDISQILSAVDIMVMPSRFEGLPLTLVEAQMSDLPCVVSKEITREAKFTENVEYVDSWDISQWISAIERKMDLKRECHPEEKYASGFNIHNSVRALEEVLLSK